MAPAPAIHVQGLVKHYINPKTQTVTEALKGIDLTVPRGSIFGLLGPNGAGKSTLINILAGLVNKTSGVASICGHDIDVDTRAARQAIGIVPQELIMDPFFPVYEAVDIHAGYYGIPASERRTDEILAAVGLTEQAYTPARRLSGGMKRRLLVAKALVHQPQVLVLDEPTAGVDVALREQLWGYVKELHANGTTVLLTTHYLEEAEALCDTIAVIDKGNCVIQDSKANLLKLLDHKCITIILDTPINTVPEALNVFDTSITDEGNLVISYHSLKTSFSEILQALGSCTLSIRDLSTQEADLEDIFKHILKAA